MSSTTDYSKGRPCAFAPLTCSAEPSCTGRRLGALTHSQMTLTTKSVPSSMDLIRLRSQTAQAPPPTLRSRTRASHLLANTTTAAGNVAQFTSWGASLGQMPTSTPAFALLQVQREFRRPQYLAFE